MVTAFVTDYIGKEWPHHCIDDGVLCPANGSLVLIYDRNEKGHIKEGHIYAPGHWKEVSIQTEE